jgi:hypothetical protein
MKSNVLLTIFAGLVTITLSSSASAQIVYSENFNNTGFQGGSIGVSFSDRWANTAYYSINTFDGWTFSSSAIYALKNDGSGDGALLLNEVGGQGSVVVFGLSAGQTYQLSFLQWGDNNPGQPYSGDVKVDGNTLLTYNGTDLAAGTNPGTVRSLQFTAAGPSATLLFRETNGGPASPIIDNVQVSVVPEPGGITLALFGTALTALGLFRARRRSS